MPRRHVQPRHRSPRSLKRTLGRFAGDVTGILPSAGVARTVGVLGIAGAAAGAGMLTFSDAQASTAAATSTHVLTRTSTVVQSSSAIQRQAQALIAEHLDASPNQASRSAVRPALLSVQRATKSAALPVTRQAVGGAMTKAVVAPSPKQIAMALLPSYGWDSSQFSCLDAIWTRESNWDPHATNSSSGAYGIPQSLPGSKMATYGSDWATNAETQIKWGLAYIRSSYGSPCGAWSFWQSHSWY